MAVQLVLGEWVTVSAGRQRTLLVFPEDHKVGAFWLAIRGQGPVLIEMTDDELGEPAGAFQLAPLEVRIRRGECCLSVPASREVAVRLSGRATGFPAEEDGRGYLPEPPQPSPKQREKDARLRQAELAGGRAQLEAERTLPIRPAPEGQWAPPSRELPKDEPRAEFDMAHPQGPGGGNVTTPPAPDPRRQLAEHLAPDMVQPKPEAPKKAQSRWGFGNSKKGG